MLVAITAPSDNTRGPRFMEKALAAIHRSLAKRQTLQLEYGCQRARVTLFYRCADQIDNFVRRPIEANYPGSKLVRVDESESPQDHRTWAMQLSLRPQLFPILRHSQFVDLIDHQFADPIEDILKSVAPDGVTSARIELHISPASAARSWWARGSIERLDRPFFRDHSDLAALYARNIMRRLRWLLVVPLGMLATRDRNLRNQIDTSAGRHHEREDDVQAASDKLGGHVFETSIRLVVSAPKDAETVARAKLQMMAGAIGAVSLSRLARFQRSRIRYGSLKRLPRRGFLMSHEELATLFHIPTANVQAESFQTTDYRELEAPTTFNAEREEGSVGLGRVQHRSNEREFGISREDRRRHIYIVGKTGMGKTTLLLKQIQEDIGAGRGVCVIDPHGDLADDVLRSLPTHRTNDVIVFDPADDDFSISYNPLACFDPGKRDLVADDVLAAFQKLYNLSDTPRLCDTLRNALYVLVEKEKTLLHLLRMLSNKTYRDGITHRIEDAVAREFWQNEFTDWDKRYRTEAMSAIQNKVRPFLLNKKVRRIVGQGGNSLNLRQVMDEGKILVVRLSKGAIGSVNARLLGALLVTGIQQAAMNREDQPEDARRDFYLYVDEFQNFTTGSFEEIMSEARKYRLNLIVSHQYVGQLDYDTTRAVFGNVGSMIAFQVGPEDARLLAEQFSKTEGQVQPHHLMNLPKYTAYVRLLIDGVPSQPFSMQTLKADGPSEDRLGIVRHVSRRQHANAADKVQQQIERAFTSA